MMPRHTLTMSLVLLAPLGTAACNGDDASSATSTGLGTATTLADDRFPDVIAVDAERADDRTWSFAVTISSPYDTPARYADGWRVVGPDGTVYGEHTLTHDHADEQPFTRRQHGVEVPDGVDRVTVEGRDSSNGFGGGVVTITLDTTTP